MFLEKMFDLIIHTQAVSRRLISEGEGQLMFQINFWGDLFSNITQKCSHNQVSLLNSKGLVNISKVGEAIVLF